MVFVFVTIEGAFLKQYPENTPPHLDVLSPDKLVQFEILDFTKKDCKAQALYSFV